jgi:hypothetical protein
MARKSKLLVFAATLTALGTYTHVSANIALAQAYKPVLVTRLFTGPDGLTHAEDIHVKLSGDPQNQASEMLTASGAEIHRYPSGHVNDWHVAPRRQLVITVMGKGEIEVAGGKRIAIGLGHILLVEDLTGKGHITRVVGNEDRVTVQVPLIGPVGSLR